MPFTSTFSKPAIFFGGIMLLINVKFQEEYKKLDALCKDMLDSETGVTEYINQMELIPPKDQALVYCFAEDYKNLKHYRWVRNKLAHEVGAIDEVLCDDEDVEWIVEFTSRIKSGRDPFSVIYNYKKEQEEQRARIRAQRKAELKKAELEATKKKEEVSLENEERPLENTTKKASTKKKATTKNTAKAKKSSNDEGASLWTKFINGFKSLLKL